MQSSNVFISVDFGSSNDFSDSILNFLNFDDSDFSFLGRKRFDDDDDGGDDDDDDDDDISPLGKFRTIDGSENNGDRGELNTQLIRLFDNAFEDGISVPRGGEFVASTLPNPRTISNTVNAQSESVPNFLGASDWLWQWGQLLDHDFALNEDNEEQDPRGEFTPIVVPDGDPTFDDGTVLSFVRVPADAGTGNDAADPSPDNPRQINNQITAFLDASAVYGSEEERAEFLRTFDKGLLKITESDSGEILLPFNTADLPNATGGIDLLPEEQFIAGDVRVNEQIGLIAVHTLLVREHNRLAEDLYERLEADEEELVEKFEDFEEAFLEEDPAATFAEIEDEFIYETARKVVGAQVQAITYNEFLPLLIGEGTLEEYEGFDANIDPQVSLEFANAAYRLGHTLLSDQLRSVDVNGTSERALADAFFVPEIAIEEGLDSLLQGLTFQEAQEVDNLIVDGVRNFLFPAGTGGLDLAAVNIARGREVGLPGYTEIYAEIFGTEITSFDDLGSSGLDLFDDAVVDLFEAAYDSVDQIDLWVGGVSELPDEHGGLLGPTLSFFVADQFARSRDGDEFFYLQEEQLEHLRIVDEDIEDVTLADIIRRNTDASYLVPDDAFQVPFETSIFGDDTDNTLNGTNRDNLIDGREGNDVITGRRGDDFLFGGADNDRISGNRGSDVLVGGDGDDTLSGGAGRDTLVGGAGSDVLRGNGGADTFVFEDSIIGDSVFDTDTIRNFQTSDSLDFTDFLEAGGTLDFERTSRTSLKIDLNDGGDRVDVFGSNRALNAVEDELSLLVA